MFGDPWSSICIYKRPESLKNCRWGLLPAFVWVNSLNKILLLNERMNCELLKG